MLPENEWFVYREAHEGPQRGFASLSRNQRRSECGVLFDRSYCVRQEHARRLCRVAARGGRIDP